MEPTKKDTRKEEKETWIGSGVLRGVDLGKCLQNDESLKERYGNTVLVRLVGDCLFEPLFSTGVPKLWPGVQMQP